MLSCLRSHSCALVLCRSSTLITFLELGGWSDTQHLQVRSHHAKRLLLLCVSESIFLMHFGFPVCPSCSCWLDVSRSLFLWCSPSDKLPFVGVIFVNAHTHMLRVLNCISLLVFKIFQLFSMMSWSSFILLLPCSPCSASHFLSDFWGILDVKCVIGSVLDRLVCNLLPVFTSLLVVLSSPSQVYRPSS